MTLINALACRSLSEEHICAISVVIGLMDVSRLARIRIAMLLQSNLCHFGCSRDAQDLLVVTWLHHVTSWYCRHVSRVGIVDSVSTLTSIKGRVHELLIDIFTVHLRRPTIHHAASVVHSDEL